MYAMQARQIVEAYGSVNAAAKATGIPRSTLRWRLSAEAKSAATQQVTPQVTQQVSRVVILSDLHCGHEVGLTPHPWHYSEERKASVAAIQRECWVWWVNEASALGPVDLCIVNGDAIDGKAARSGGVELITADLDEQVTMAYNAIRMVRARQYAMSYGTDYHTAQEGQDYEKRLADMLDAPIGGHEWATVGGKTIDYKHHLGSSSIPWGRHTAISRERVQNALWAERQGAPRADIFVRSHVHYYSQAGDSTFSAYVTPALQAPGSRYGIRRCSGTVDFGFLELLIYPTHHYVIPHILRPASCMPSVLEA